MVDDPGSAGVAFGAKKTDIAPVGLRTERGLGGPNRSTPGEAMQKTSYSLFVEGLARQVEALTQAGSPALVLRSLLESTRLAAPRAALFVLRQGRLKGWECTGYDQRVLQRLRAFSTAADAGWLGRLARSDGALHERRPSAGDPDFGQDVPTERFGVALKVRGRPLVLVMLERSGEETPWFPPLAAMLGRVAEMRLALDVTARQQASDQGPGTAEPAAAPAAAERSAPPTPPASATVAPQVPQAFYEEEQQLTAARRFARLVASDIRLYNEEAVLLGRRNGDLAVRLADDLARGQQTFLRRHGSLGPVGRKILYESYVEVLAGGDERLLPDSVLD